MTKFILQFKPTPTLPEAVLAFGGITSLNTAQVIGPRPKENAQTKEMIPMHDRMERDEFRPMARRRAERDMSKQERRSRGFEPVLYSVMVSYP